MKYRPEIDGLRAIAVIPVILFHAGLEYFKGGFIGVDVFFVISGYLITTILVNELDTDQFSLLNFYERRARRILPALVFVVLACLPFATLWMSPSQFEDFAISIVAVSLFVSNFLFWSQSGYFESAAEEKPLLHTWSLAVEEQYYILFPVFLFFTWRYGKNKIFWFLIALSIASLFLSEILWRFDRNANFYLSPTRAWELFTGSLCSLYLNKRKRNKNDFLGAIGLIAILASVFLFDQSTPTPSLYTLVPVLGTALVIIFTNDESLVTKVLSNRLFVGIGLISYSAYLWHQPLFSFARIKTVEDPSLALMTMLTALTLILGFLTWKFIEAPFRDKVKYPRRKVITNASATILVGILTGLMLTHLDQFRFNEEQKKILAVGEKNRQIMKFEAYDRFGCFFDQTQSADHLVSQNCIKPSLKERLILFGDSKASHFYEGMKNTFVGHEVMQFTGASCRAINFSDNSSRCKEFYELFMAEILPTLKMTDTIIVSSNWWNTYRKIGLEEFEKSLTSLLKVLKQTQANVYVFTNSPEFIYNPYEEIAKIKDTVPVDSYYLNSQPIWASDKSIKKISNELGLVTFDVSDTLCESNNSCLFKDNHDYLYFDKGHLSFYGSLKLSEQFKSTIFK